jgi:hypothetical protein
MVVDHMTGQRAWVPNMRAAMRTAKVWASRRPGRGIHIHLVNSGNRFTPANLVAVIRRIGHRYTVRFNDGLRGLGDALTDWACSSHEFVSTWQRRVNEAVDTGTQAAVLAAAAAGAVGSLLDNPLLGAVAGAAVGWSAHAIWTAPHRL